MLLLAWTVVRAQQEPVLVRVGEVWQFYKAATEPAGEPLAWTRSGYSVGPDWLSGRTGIGTYIGGRDAENVLLFDRNYNYVAVCFRREFRVESPGSVRRLTLRLDYQEGFVAYLNGMEILRVGLAGQVGQPVPVASLAATRFTTRPVEFLLNPEVVGLLKEGTNTLAIQMHTDRVGPGFPASPTSGDLLCLPELLANFVRGPFVQNVSTGAAHVVWRTSQPGGGRVEYGVSPGQLDRQVTVSGEDLQHDVALEGLEADSRYYYRVRSRVGEVEMVSPVASFKTLKNEGDVHWCVLGDSGSGAEPQYRVAEQLRAWDPDLVIHCGDIIYSSFDPYRVDTRCLSVYGPHMRSTPYFFSVGNHDMYYDQSASYLAAFSLPTNSVSAETLRMERTAPEHYYSFDHGDVHFVCLYVPQLGYYDFKPGSAQYEWLDRDLAATRKKWKILFHHMPSHTSGPHIYDDTDFDGVLDADQLREALIPLAQRHGVNAIFAGHDHLYERFAPDRGVHCITTGAGGVVPLYGLSVLDPLSAKLYVAYHFTDVRISGDTLTLKAVGTNDVVFDEMVIQRVPPPVKTYSVPWAALAFPDVGGSDGDGNLAGQRWPFGVGGEGMIQSSSGKFADLGQMRLACDNTNLFIGLEKVMLPPGADVVVFVESPNLPGVAGMESLGNRVFDPSQQGVDGLDFLKNLAFSKFRPAVACVLGDEFADGTSRSFWRAGSAFPGGQGVFRLDPQLSSVVGAKVQQFNRSPQNYAFPIESNADLMVVSIPLRELGSPAPSASLQVGAIAVRGIGDTNQFTREIDTGFVGALLKGEGTNAVELEGLGMVLPADADPDKDGLVTELELQLGTDPLKADTDGDGLLDGWEVANRTNPTVATGLDGAFGDLDGDGLSNLDEQRIGTNPRDRASGVRLQFERSLDGAVELSWPGLANTVCVVEASPVVGGRFEVLGEVEPSEAVRGLFRVLVDTEAKFLRVRFRPKAP